MDKLTYYKVKKPSDLIPNYVDYIHNQIDESYIADKIVPLAKHLKPKIKSLKIEVHTSESKPPEKRVNDNTRFIQEKFATVDRNKSVLDCACQGGACLLYTSPSPRDRS